MIKLKSLIKEYDLIDKQPNDSTDPDENPFIGKSWEKDISHNNEKELIKVPQKKWNEFLEQITDMIVTTKKIPKEKAWKLTYGILGGKRILTPSMFNIILRMTNVQFGTLDHYTDGHALRIYKILKKLYNDFAIKYNEGYGKLKGQKKAKLFGQPIGGTNHAP